MVLRRASSARDRHIVTTELEAAAPPRSPSGAALRIRRHRERRRRKLHCLTIELRKTEIDALVRKGMLEAETRNNRQAIRLALYSFLESTLPKESKAEARPSRGRTISSRCRAA